VHASAFSQPLALVVMWAPVPVGTERLRKHAFWEFAIAQAVRTQVQRLGGVLIQQWHLWLVDPPPSVCEMVWRVVVLDAIWASVFFFRFGLTPQYPRNAETASSLSPSFPLE
jgi:hypothetical protein